MRQYRPYILPDGTEIPGHWYQNPERFVATPHGWKKLREWRLNQGEWCDRMGRYGWHFGNEFHHKHGRGGGKRDDRLESLEWLCRAHHEKTPILRRPSLLEKTQ